MVTEDVVKLCLTPTRNEVWIIDRFLRAAQSWASKIIVADQGSTDGTLERLQDDGGVSLVINDSPVFDEGVRQKLLIDRAREIPGRRVLIALDADEALSANAVSSPDWSRIEMARPGTVIRFRWVNVLPGFEKAWIPENRLACGFVDDGSEHMVSSMIHNKRIPIHPGAPVLDLDDIVVLHFQYTLWDRMLSKQRWYQAWECVNRPERSALDIFRQYNHMHGSWDASELTPICDAWLSNYDKANIDFRSLKTETITWWDREVLSMFHRYGPARFRKALMWNHDWNAVAAEIDKKPRNIDDPRTMRERLIHVILQKTQRHRQNLGVRAFEKLLRMQGW